MSPVVEMVMVGARYGRNADPAHVFATRPAVDALIARLGGAGDVVEIPRGLGMVVQVTVPDMRGPRGALRLHALACAAGIPVHVT
jgi:hypothetical protein